MFLTPGQHAPKTLLRELERDIDAVLMEDLVCSSEVRDWVANAVGDKRLESASNTVIGLRQMSREDDGRDIGIEVDGVPILTISNRLLPRPRLCATARANTDEGKLLLLRPQGAARRCAELDPLYDAVLTHDVYAALLHARGAGQGGELGERLRYRTARLDEALVAAREALAVAPLTSTEDLLRGYLGILQSVQPDLPAHPHLLDMRADPAHPMVIFAPETLPKWTFLPPMRLAHHLTEGVVSLCFGGWGAHFKEHMQVMEPVLARTPYDLAISAEHGADSLQGLMVVDTVEPMSLERAAEEQHDAIVGAIAAADRLRCWFAGQHVSARYWADVAGMANTSDHQTRLRRELLLR